MRKCVYAGSFDPPTNGHLWMIEKGAGLFDELVVAIGTNPEKGYMFSVDERAGMLRECTRGLDCVTVDSFRNKYLVDYAKVAGAGYILRGLRAQGDFDYERMMRYVNSDMDPGIITVFLMPPRELREISSSLVKGLVGPEGWEQAVSRYVPVAVLNRLVGRFRNARTG